MRNLGRVFVPQPQIEVARQQLEKIYSTDPVQPELSLNTEQTQTVLSLNTEQTQTVLRLNTEQTQTVLRLNTEQTLDEPAANNATVTPSKTNIKQTERIPKTTTTATKTGCTQPVLSPYSARTQPESVVNKIKTAPTQDEHKSNTTTTKTDRTQAELIPNADRTQTKRRQLSGDSRSVVYREKLEGSLAKLGLGDDAIARIKERAAARLA